MRAVVPPLPSAVAVVGVPADEARSSVPISSIPEAAAAVFAAAPVMVKPLRLRKLRKLTVVMNEGKSNIQLRFN